VRSGAPHRAQLVGRPGFSRPRDVTSAIQAALGLLRVPRSALGISAASKGAVAGELRWRVGLSADVPRLP
jgi:hypothetical protein